MTAPTTPAAALPVAVHDAIDLFLGAVNDCNDLTEADGDDEIDAAIARRNAALVTLRAAVVAYGRECAAEALALGMAGCVEEVRAAEARSQAEGWAGARAAGWDAALAEVNAACERIAGLDHTTGTHWMNIGLCVETRDGQRHSWYVEDHTDGAVSVDAPTPTAAILAAAVALDGEAEDGR